MLLIGCRRPGYLEAGQPDETVIEPEGFSNQFFKSLLWFFVLPIQRYLRRLKFPFKPCDFLACLLECPQRQIQPSQPGLVQARHPRRVEPDRHLHNSTAPIFVS